MAAIVPQWTPEAAFAEFVKHFDEFSQLHARANEAETRLKIVDTLMFDVLGWEKSDVEVEKYCRYTGFADYVFLVRGQFSLVIEAKRTGVSFTVPDAVFKPEPVAFGLIEQETKEAGEALRQALGYAASLGCRYIAISNGAQWLLALTYVQAQRLEERPVIVFDGFESIRNNFRRFWDCFSRVGVAENHVAPLLLESRKKPAPAKLSTSIPGYPVPSQRNVFVNELSYILETVWDVLSRTESTLTFLQTCYVAPRTNENLVGFAKDLLQRRIAADAIIHNSSVEDADATRLKPAIIGYSNEKPFVVLGNVGHGKTTFLNYLRLVAAQTTLDSYVQLDVNFLDRPDDAAEVNDFIYREIEQQLLNIHHIDIFEDNIVPGALHTQIERFYKSSRYKLISSDEAAAKREETAFIQEQIRDRHEYYKALVRHLKRGQGKSVAVFFDNLDRRNPGIQEAAFLKASAIARDWECVVFICLRPSTFYDSLKRGLLDSLAPKTFAVGSPDLSLVLKKRFDFSAKVALGEIDTPVLREALRSKDVSFRLPSIAKIFACCELSARKEANTIQMLVALSNGNIRNLLELTKRILVSGYLDTRKILAKIEEQGGYDVPDFEAVKTLLYGDYDHYNPKSSIFINLFDIYHSDPKEHLLRVLALFYLNKFRNKDEARSSIPLDDLLAYLESFYFDVVTIQRHLVVLSESGCIDTGIAISGDAMRASHVEITTRGAYHINNLVCEFQYVDAMTVDTPITCSIARVLIGDDSYIDARVKRTRAFLAYLQKCAEQLVEGEGQGICSELLDIGIRNCDLVEQRSRGRSRSRPKYVPRSEQRREY